MVRRYFRHGVAGWRLDPAYVLGPAYLAELTQAAHAEKRGSLVVGEIVNHPSGWMPAMDAVMNFHWRTPLPKLVSGELASAPAARTHEHSQPPALFFTHPDDEGHAHSIVNVNLDAIG